ncbi:MAG TPA: ABC transporter ATP-binding protein [Candidatus Dormibacteraeota bacterium]|nr:ABC transporter ATP-binding protein [Candidatus Dormibacteraeota bacterium]
MIELRGAGVRLGGEWVLRDVDLDVAPGECRGLLGANGSGRTTLLRLCAGLLAPGRGSVRIAGLDTRRAAAAVRGRVGYVPQRAGTVDGQTVREELGLAAACQGIAPGRRRAIAGDLLELVSLGDAADREVARLSPGQHRRLLLARALVHDPVVLLLDAPDAGLDEDACADLADLLVELRDLGKTLLVAGSPWLVRDACDGAVVLDGGRLAASSAPHREAEREVPA